MSIGVLVQFANQVVTELVLEPINSAGSTVANVLISLGNPASFIGVTTGDLMHREDEFINLEPIPTGFANLITVILESADALA